MCLSAKSLLSFMNSSLLSRTQYQQFLFSRVLEWKSPLTLFLFLFSSYFQSVQSAVVMHNKMRQNIVSVPSHNIFISSRVRSSLAEGSTEDSRLTYAIFLLDLSSFVGIFDPDSPNTCFALSSFLLCALLNVQQFWWAPSLNLELLVKCIILSTYSAFCIPFWSTVTESGGTHMHAERPTSFSHNYVEWTFAMSAGSVLCISDLSTNTCCPELNVACAGLFCTSDTCGGLCSLRCSTRLAVKSFQLTEKQFSKREWLEWLHHIVWDFAGWV